MNLMNLVFRMLLRLNPQRHRDSLGAEKEAIFERGAKEHRRLGPAAYARFLLKEAAGVVLDAAAARFAEAAHKGRLENPAFHATPASTGICRQTSKRRAGSP